METSIQLLEGFRTPILQVACYKVESLKLDKRVAEEVEPTKTENPAAVVRALVGTSTLKLGEIDGKRAIELANSASW